MFDFFPDQPAYEYPDLVNITYSLVWAFLLASIIAITHRVTFLGEQYPKNFFQSLVLGSIVTAMVMMAIGDSLARGLGVFGAMAIIRFRTRIDDPRNVLFLFAALSCGLAVGVYGYSISLAGTVIFCSIAFILHFSPFRSYFHSHKVTVGVDDPAQINQIIEVLERYCGEYRQVGIAITKDTSTRYEYSVSLKKDASKNGLMNDLKNIAGVKLVRISPIEMEFNRM